MNAKEARERSLKITGDAEKAQLNEIHKRIADQVNIGNFSLSYYKDLLPAVRKKLDEEGYNINQYFDQQDGTTVTIKW